MGTKAFFTVISLLILCGWSTQQTHEIKEIEWLIGTWELKTTKGSLYETWSKKSNDEFDGKSYRLKDQDTIVFETIQLIQEKEVLFYIPTVKNQNNNSPVRFTSRTISANEMVFENRQHDFPQVISYKKVTTDSLVAEISGIVNGKEQKQTYPMKRLK